MSVEIEELSERLRATASQYSPKTRFVYRDDKLIVTRIEVFQSPLVTDKPWVAFVKVEEEFVEVKSSGCCVVM